MTGPFKTEREASAAAAGAGDNREMLSAALAAAGVETGAYDEQILDWLAGYEPSTVAVICGLIDRAREAALQQAQNVIAGLYVKERTEGET